MGKRGMSSVPRNNQAIATGMTVDRSTRLTAPT
jgi:hypothetical protein